MNTIEGSSFSLTAERPPKPTDNRLPELPVEELVTLRANRKPMLDRRSFERIVRAVMTKGSWQENPAMADRNSPGFVYEDDFKTLVGCEGRLHVSVGFWTRAGASKPPAGFSGDFYWTAFVDVFDSFCSWTSRRFPKPEPIYRLQVWDDQLARVTPSGSVGGLIPNQIPEDVRPTLAKLLYGLGFMSSEQQDFFSTVTN